MSCKQCGTDIEHYERIATPTPELCDRCRAGQQELARKDAKILEWANRIEELYRFQSGCPEVVAEMRKEVEP